MKNIDRNSVNDAQRVFEKLLPIKMDNLFDLIQDMNIVFRSKRMKFLFYVIE